jgi:hypothetical protein
LDIHEVWPLVSHRIERFLYSIRGKVAIRDKLRNILLFNGFLPVIDEGLRDEDIAEIEEEAEVSSSLMAWRLFDCRDRTLEKYVFSDITMISRPRLQRRHLNFKNTKSCSYVISSM